MTVDVGVRYHFTFKLQVQSLLKMTNKRLAAELVY